MIDQDPLFGDAPGGDFTLQDSSPCIDAGDPSSQPGGLGIDLVPTRLDGDLDGSLIVDLGAHEFSHVRLDWSGSATPGGTVTLETTGTPGHAVTLWYSLGSAENFLPNYGGLFIDFGSAWGLSAFGVIPSQVPVDIPPDFPAPLELTLQHLALEPTTQHGTMSNVVTLAVE